MLVRARLVFSVPSSGNPVVVRRVLARRLHSYLRASRAVTSVSAYIAVAVCMPRLQIPGGSFGFVGLGKFAFPSYSDSGIGKHVHGP